MACEPCVSKLDLTETARQADVIIIGKRVGAAPYAEGKGPGGPEWVDIAVSQTIKGQSGQDILRVNSWDGMCPYGIVIGNNSYVLFLQKRQNADGFQYDAVNSGCAEKAFVVENGVVDIQGEKKEWGSFRTMIGLPQERLSMQLSALVGLFLILFFIIVYLCTKKK
ncbi:hypothetical protein HY639_03600 [Candidatus Woesearchaeota archaeon]|nr:hypothetical protein [Candidatus Woesearchaeota archaeon]